MSTIRGGFEILRFACRWYSARRARLSRPTEPTLSEDPVRNTTRRRMRTSVLKVLTGWARVVTLIMAHTGCPEVANLCGRMIGTTTLTLRGKTGERRIPIVMARTRAWAWRRAVESSSGLCCEPFKTFGARRLKHACIMAGVLSSPRTAFVGPGPVGCNGVDIATAASITGHSPQVMLSTIVGCGRRAAGSGSVCSVW